MSGDRVTAAVKSGVRRVVVGDAVLTGLRVADGARENARTWVRY